MCVHMSPCARVFNFSDVLFYSRDFAQFSLYVYVCACESGCLLVLVCRCGCIWLRVYIGQIKGIPMWLNQTRTNGEAFVSRFEGGHMWFESNAHAREGLWFV